MNVQTPADFILARVAAFQRCEFDYIYDTYHPDSNFRRQFGERSEYVRYGWANLGKEFRILRCRILRQEQDMDRARVIFWLEFEFHGAHQGYAELAWLEQSDNSWCYRCGQKLTGDELPVPLEQLDFRHFDTIPDRVLY